MTGELLLLDEHNRLVKLEQTIETGLKTFVDVGNALLEIREDRLYRTTHSRFEDYCKARWDFSYTYAYRLIEAAEAVGNIKTLPIGKVLPATESQARPLTSLTPDEQREAWQKAVDTAPNGKVTAEHVQNVAKEYRPKQENKKPDKPQGQLAPVEKRKEVVELDDEEKQNAYFFGLYQEGEKLYNAWFDAESPVSRQMYREQLCNLMIRVDKER